MKLKFLGFRARVSHHYSRACLSLVCCPCAQRDGGFGWAVPGVSVPGAAVAALPRPSGALGKRSGCSGGAQAELPLSRGGAAAPAAQTGIHLTAELLPLTSFLLQAPLRLPSCCRVSQILPVGRGGLIPMVQMHRDSVCGASPGLFPAPLSAGCSPFCKHSAALHPWGEHVMAV